MIDMASQRFCLRWNNHQSNLLSVFDQLLQEEAFVDVTLAVEGKHLRAHKMVLSACSPYFQSLFVDHPDKHPIVILKDVPYSDMKSLLDFMYRGEVSVDQDRLTAFLKVAESLKIKGLTEVNEERCDLPSIANSLLATAPPPVVAPVTPPVAPNNPGPPPSLHRLPLSTRRMSSSFSSDGIPRRKRGRPRKLECGPTDIKFNNVSHNHVHEMSNGSVYGNLVHKEQNNTDDKETMDLKSSSPLSTAASEPTPSTSQQENAVSAGKDESVGAEESNVMATDNPSPQECFLSSRTDGKGIVRVMGNCNSLHTQVPVHSPQHAMASPHTLPVQPVTHQVQPVTPGTPTQPSTHTQPNTPTQPSTPQQPNEEGVIDMDIESDSDSLTVDGQDNNNTDSKENPSANAKKRVRRRVASSLDPAEALTEMSVRGLNLFRYASIDEGLYKCTECAKDNVIKTFKNKYSFQRHAFLYHEGHQRKVFPCPVCTKEFSRPDKMKNHMKTVHDCFMPKEIMFPPVNYYMPQ